MQEINISRADISFLGQCKRILLNSDIGRVYFASEQNAEDVLREGIGAEEFYVATDDGGKCLGFLWFAWKSMFHSFPYAHMLIIDEAYRGRGIGTALLRHHEGLVFPEYSKTFLVVADFNPRAKKLYESIGYVVVGAIPGLYKEGITEYLMMKKRPVKLD